MSVSLWHDEPPNFTTLATAEPVCNIFKCLSKMKWNGNTLQNVNGLIFGSEKIASTPY